MSLNEQQKKQLAQALVDEDVNIDWAALFDKAVETNHYTAKQLVNEAVERQDNPPLGIMAMHKQLANELDYAHYATWACIALVAVLGGVIAFFNLSTNATTVLAVFAASIGLFAFFPGSHYYGTVRNFRRAHKTKRKKKQSQYDFEMQVPQPVQLRARIEKDGDVPVVNIHKVYPGYVTRQKRIHLRNEGVASITEQFDDVLSIIGERQSQLNEEYYRLLHKHGLDPDSLEMRRQQLIDEFLAQFKEKQLDEEVLKSLNEHAISREKERLQEDASLFSGVDQRLSEDIAAMKTSEQQAVRTAQSTVSSGTKA
jgi:hypothetical protein